MESVRVLICDDNEAVHESLSTYLRSVNIDTVSAYNGPDALNILESESIDLVILDIMLPGVFGTEVCKRIRRTSNVPIIILSAKSEELDRVLGLELGADDYVTKPFFPREIAARIGVILKRTASNEGGGLDRDKIVFNELVIDLRAAVVSINGREVSFTAKEMATLAFLVSNRGAALHRDIILGAVWGDDYFGDNRSVDAIIKRIRKKLPENVSFEISSVYGLGYKLEEKT